MIKSHFKFLNGYLLECIRGTNHREDLKFRDAS